jgi:3-methyladenine DNA glycosylase/8-oxoguanine DNA glycosylase
VSIVRLSLSLRRCLVSQFTASDLRHLAATMEAGSPGMIARSRLSDASIDELAEMLTAGRKPTYGWWCRNTTVAA